MKFQERLKQLEDKIKDTYEQGVTMEEAEKLAAEFLHAQLLVSSELTKSDLDSRMRKSGVKAIKASVYLAKVQESDKKPSDTYLEQVINEHEIVNKEQDAFDQAEVRRNELERYYNIFGNAHIHFRTVAKGRFE